MTFEILSLLLKCMLLIESVIINFVLAVNPTLKDQNQGYRNRYNILIVAIKLITSVI